MARMRAKREERVRMMDEAEKSEDEMKKKEETGGGGSGKDDKKVDGKKADACPQITEMPPKKRAAPVQSSPRVTRSTRSSSRRTAASNPNDEIPDAVREMVTEVRRAEQQTSSASVDGPERPLKRKRPGQKVIAPTEDDAPSKKPKSSSKTAIAKVVSNGVDEDGGDFRFEDVAIPAPTIQTMVRDTDDEEDDDDELQFEDVEIDPGTPGSSKKSTVPISSGYEPPKELTLHLSAHMSAASPRKDRRKAIGREERERRVEIHKAHLLCLMAHVEQRNRWCNDPQVQNALSGLLSQKRKGFLLPRSSLNQFGQTESLKRGLQEAKEVFKSKFTITERGLRRALWVEDEEQLKDYKLPDDIESTKNKKDFLQAARKLKGSRDVGAQLFCALLRSIGVEARLACSLQPLSCVPGAPTMPKEPNPRKGSQPKGGPTKAEIYAAAMAKHETKYPEFLPSATTPTPSARARLGHPNAMAYHIPSLETLQPPTPPSPPKQIIKPIRGESPFPVYWVEVLNVAHQKWHPVDPLVTFKQFNPRALEPPANDRLNSMTYVVAFNEDGTARDVTRRYVKAYNSKTRRMRVDGLPPSSGITKISGERWWRRVMKHYTSPLFPTDLDQIELNELAAEEAKEPMPRNVADFKDHPIYALERHLRRNEVLVPGAQSTGTVSAGAKAPLERIYRRRDVKVARTREKWYRMGRLVKPDEEPVKILPKRRRINSLHDSKYDHDSDEDGGDELLFGEGPGNPIYMESQTELYVAPAVVNGRVPKNKFGNLDVYVPSMVPPGGAYITHERAAHAAYILGVDYAPALTGFEFKGRHGTAVLRGVVVPEECKEGVEAVIMGLDDLEAEMEAERRSRMALRMWSRFLKALRIRERIWEGVDEDAEEEMMDAQRGKKDEVDAEMGEGGEDEEDGGGGGGFFLPNDELSDDEGGGGFIEEDGGDLQPTSQIHIVTILGKMGTKRKRTAGHETTSKNPTDARTRAGPLAKNWPKSTPYLTQPLYSQHLAPAHLSAIRTLPKPNEEQLPEIPLDVQLGPCAKVVIMPINDPLHPAKGQHGLFAAEYLPPNTFILPYLGEMHIGTPPFTSSSPSQPGQSDIPSPPPPPPLEKGTTSGTAKHPPSSIPTSEQKHTPPSSDAVNKSLIQEEMGEQEKAEEENYDYSKSDYDLWLDREADIAVDAARYGNEARFVNDYRGVPGAQRANAEFRVAWDLRRGEKTMAVYVLPVGKKTLQKAERQGLKGPVGGIKKGEEILVSYGRGFWEERRREMGESTQQEW
ncbi:hypothetical protein QBC35DRAFT_472754 [Podospora australis]|uniref:DNA repair protein rhp41 n=1 Tax=Podospora australis TaxID=1536484 RepID=A0AAN7AI08_9PEZI|nr:hypothetical protein QBC35DRAFT_472754 [Podospora australis]